MKAIIFIFPSWDGDFGLDLLWFATAPQAQAPSHLDG
jgi:hypothetical protein